MTSAVSTEASSRSTLLSWMYETMLVIRTLEEEVHRLEAMRRIRGLVHTYAGQEAVATGVCAALKTDDYLASTHRGHGHCIAKGADLNAVAAELFGRMTGLAKGKGGDMHMGDTSIGLLGTTGMVGGGVPLAVGAALSSKMLDLGRVAVAFFGDHALAQGTVHESINLASVWELPVIFVRENNHYGGPVHEELVISCRDPEAWARTYGLEAITVDGMDVLAVYEAAKAAVEHCRQGKGPYFIEADTYRFHGATTWDTDTSSYRPQEEEEAYRTRDPLLVFRNRQIAAETLSESRWQAIEERAVGRVKEALEFADSSAYPDAMETYTDVYSNLVVTPDKW